MLENNPSKQSPPWTDMDKFEMYDLLDLQIEMCSPQSSTLSNISTSGPTIHVYRVLPSSLVNKQNNTKAVYLMDSSIISPSLTDVSVQPTKSCSLHMSSMSDCWTSRWLRSHWKYAKTESLNKGSFCLLFHLIKFKHHF